MKSRTSLGLLILLWMLTKTSSFADYTLNLPAGFSAIANQLDNGANSLSDLFPPGTETDSLQLFFPNTCATDSYVVYTYDSMFGGWVDQNLNPINPSTVILAPGFGALIYVPVAGLNLTFTGLPHIPVLPVALPCGCGTYYMLSRQTPDVGTYEAVTGFLPTEGAQVLRYNHANNTWVPSTYTAGAWVPGVPTLNVGESAWFYIPCGSGVISQWQQSPDTSANGLDVRATGPKILADDFRCNETGPITEIRIYGSWLHDYPAPQACFTLGIWSDVPAQGTNFSRPGQLLCNHSFSPGQYSYSIYSQGVEEQFFDPNIPGIVGSDTIIWQYTFDLALSNACWQTNGSTYWVSVWADCFDTNQFLFGWKTCSTNWNDDAVYGHVNTAGTPLGDWKELRRPPAYTNSLDLAFAILKPSPPLPANLGAVKWLQIPDRSTNGLDVRATGPKILADDFQCTASGAITQIKIWGSWLNDQLPPVPPHFCLGLWSDAPAGRSNVWSQPLELLCVNCFNPGQYTYRTYASNRYEHFYDPNIPAIIGADTIIWEYTFDVPLADACWQTNGNIYWLSLTASGFDSNQFLFGWKTCPTNWNDDAVFGHVATSGAPLGDWQELLRPYSYSNSLDLAFQLTTTPSTNPPPSTAVVKWLQIPDRSPQGLDVRATGPKILADDFLCTASGAITQMKIWGSWLNDQLPPVPPHFCLGLWSDAPAGRSNVWSRPLELLCVNCFDPGEYTYLPYASGVYEYFFDPNIPAIIGGDSIIWEYTFVVPLSQACIQTNGNIYWLSLTASGFDTNQYLFGWKTCPTNWNDDAVFGHVDFSGTPLGDWQELLRPNSYSNSLDLAFQLTTTTAATNPPSTVVQKWLQIPDRSTNGLDVRVTDPKVLADDFRCDLTGPITQIRIWGSWLNDVVPAQQPCFCLGLWSDIPRQGTNYSRPGQLLCNRCFFPGQYSYSLDSSGILEHFYDPNLPPPNGLIGTDTNIWQYVFDLPPDQSCWQTNGNTYWLSVWVDCIDTNQFLFGWKTCPTNWNDDAVYGHVDGFNNPSGDWQELRRPGTTNSLDLAFAVTTQTSQPWQLPLTVTVNRPLGTITIAWVGGGTLQEAPSVTGPWANVVPPPPSPFTIPILMNVPQKFYRVKW